MYKKTSGFSKMSRSENPRRYKRFIDIPKGCPWWILLRIGDLSKCITTATGKKTPKLQVRWLGMVGVILRLQTTANQSSIRFHCNLNFPKLFKPKRNNTPWTGQQEWVHRWPLFRIKPAITCTNLSWFNISWVQWIYESWPVKTKTQDKS